MSVKIENVSIGPESWRNRTLRGMKMSDDLIKRSSKHMSYSQSVDSLPFMRDFFIRLTNDEILKYYREIRAVVVKLRQAISSINSEIVTMTRYQERLHKELDYLRKDIIVNRDSQRMRKCRPPQEQDRDGADDLLSAESRHLWNSKKVLEIQLRNVQDMLQMLEKCRSLLQKNLEERARVMELTNESAALVKKKPTKVRPSTADPKFANLQCTVICPPVADTHEVHAALTEAVNITAEASKIRQEVDNTITKVSDLNQAAHDSVNKGLVKKVAESTHLLQHLSLCNGQNRKALQRSQTVYDRTEWSRDSLLRNEWLTCRERYYRPMVNCFQRHSGPYVPGSVEINEANHNLLKSMAQTSQDINLLNLAKLNIRNDLRSKSAAIKVDGDVFRLRRNRSSHRWPIGANF